MAPQRFDLATADGRRAAERDFWRNDHAFLRVHFQNAHQISPRMWRSNQPSPEQLAGWKARGIRTIVNLRGDNGASYTLLQKEACAELGLDLVFLPTESRGGPYPDRLAKAREAFKTMACPALMHCKSGADRVGMMSVFYLHVIEGVPLAEAVRQLDLRYLHIGAGKTGILDAFWAAWAQAQAGGHTDFWSWLTTEYDRTRFMAEYRPTGWVAWLVSLARKRRDR